MAPDGLLQIQEERSDADQLSLTLVDSPFRSAHRLLFAEPGRSISELIAALHVAERYGETVLVTVDGEAVTRDRWDHVCPAEGSIVAMRVVPQGGQKGKGIASLVIGIGLLIVATVTFKFGGAALYPTAAGFLGAAGGVSALSTAAIVAAAAASIYAGVQSLTAPAPSQGFDGDIPTSKQSKALTGALRNTFDAQGPVPEIFGRVLAVPQYAAKPYTEIVGTDTYQRLLFSFGVGPLTLTDLKLGLTPIGSFQGVETVIHPGWDDDPDLSLFIEDVDTETLGPQDFDVDDEVTPWVTRVSTADAHEGSVDIAFPVGLLCFSDGGKLREVEIDFEVEFREDGTADPWVDVPATTPLGPGLSYDSGTGRFTMKGAEQGYMARGLRWKYEDPDPGAGNGKTYEVRMRRTETRYGASNPIETSKADRMQWTLFRTIRATSKPKVANLCLVEMRILMTGQLGTLVDEFNAIAERHLKVWNSTDGWGPDTWFDPAGATPNNPQIIEKTRSHAAALGHVLRTVLEDQYIDALGLEQWDSVIGVGGEGRTFDATVDFASTVREIASDIAASARSAINVLDGKWGVIADRAQSDIVQLFTDRNSWDLQSTRIFTEALHGIRVNFGPHEAAGWIPDQRIVYADGYNEDGSDGKTAADIDKLSEINMWGVVDEEIAWKEGRYHLASVALRPEIHTIQTDLEALVCTRGDRVGLQSDVIKESLAAGRLGPLTIPGSILERGYMDEIITYDPLKSYAIAIRTKDMTVTVLPVQNLAMDSSEFVLVTPHDFSGPGVYDPAEGDLFTFGELGKEYGDYTVKAIRYGDEITATLELVAYNAAVYDSDTDPIPTWTPNITDPSPPQFKVPGTPTITRIQSDEAVLQVRPDGSVNVRIELSLEPAFSNDIDPHLFHAQIRLTSPALGDWRNAPAVDVEEPQIYFDGLETGFTYEVRARAVSHENRAGPWTAPQSHVVVGTSTPPPDIENLRVQWSPKGSDIGGDLAPEAELLWDYPQPPRDLLGFEVRHQPGTLTNWESATPIAKPKAISVNRYLISGVQQGERTFLVKAVDRSGNESTNALSITVDLGDGTDANTVASKDWQADGWLGTKTRCNVDTVPDPDELQADVNSSGFWTTDASLFWSGTDSDTFWTGSYHDFIYEDSITIAAGSLPAVLGVNITVTGQRWTLEYRIGGAGDWLPWPGTVVATAATYNFRILVDGGPIQGRVTEFDAFVNAPTIIEEVAEFSVAASGTVRVPITKTYRSIDALVLTVSHIPNTNGHTGVYLDLNATLGPSVQVLDSGGTRVASALSAIVKGH